MNVMYVDPVELAKLDVNFLAMWILKDMGSGSTLGFYLPDGSYVQVKVFCATPKANDTLPG